MPWGMQQHGTLLCAASTKETLPHPTLLMVLCGGLQDKMEVSKSGVAVFELDDKGLPQVYYYGNVKEPSSFAAQAKVGLQNDAE